MKNSSPFRDDKDGAFDVSKWLLEKKGFLPVPMIITEPAVGYGAGVGLMFFSQSIAEAAANAKATGHVTPPDIYGVVLAATENGTKFGGGGAMLSFLDDRWRYRGGVARMDVHLDFYGLGDRFGENFKMGYKLDGWISSQQAMYRLGNSNNFLAARWMYIDTKSSFDSARPILADKAFATRSSGLGVSFEHDSRNNIFTPSTGVLGAFDTLFYSKEIGSDENFQSYRAHMFAYTPLGSSFVLAGRLDGRAARGDVPFYQLPYIDMRGVPAMRYQDENVALGEVEGRWNVTDRWGLIGFVGVGHTWGKTSFDDTSSKWSKGVGFRYELARLLGLWMGMDYAWGPDKEQAFYIQVGNAWR
ncbi:BamA/TamA family outer membrane protein [Uliginosibacterium sp. H3]|uniref:BamA/TamA family outer membrane protein n=1 Tax=Uliginosibacterium silvisoli TaxID=3114758 RepID=A0ABU6K2M2_9RHOO|nr:BamA/TamA family outer membrane protein [Uliginosibacterium sp. H3]